MQDLSHEKVKFTSATYPRVIATLIHSNQFLKIFTILSMAFALLLTALVLYLVNREPLVIPIDVNGRSFEQTKLPKPEVEIERAITKYIELRYSWDPKVIKSKLEAAEAFISPISKKAYQTASLNLIRFSTEKGVSQKVFPDKFSTSLEKSVVVVSGDRITAIQGLKAAGNLSLELAFEYGPRSKENPWGVFITREKEQQ